MKREEGGGGGGASKVDVTNVWRRLGGGGGGELAEVEVKFRKKNSFSKITSMILCSNLYFM